MPFGNLQAESPEDCAFQPKVAAGNKLPASRRKRLRAGESPAPLIIHFDARRQDAARDEAVNATSTLEIIMFRYAIIFAIIALIAGALGFTGIAGTSAGIAKVLFFICLTIFVILLLVAVFVAKKMR